MGAGPSRPRYGPFGQAPPPPGMGMGMYPQQMQQMPMQQMMTGARPNMYPMVMTPMMQLSGQPVNEQMQQAIAQAQQYTRAQSGMPPAPQLVGQPGAPGVVPMPQPQLPFTQSPSQFPPPGAPAFVQPQPPAQDIPIRFSPVPPESQPLSYPRAMSRAPTFVSESSSSEGEPHRHRRRHRSRRDHERRPSAPRVIPVPGDPVGDSTAEYFGEGIAHPPPFRSRSPLKNPLPEPPKDVYLQKKYQPLLEGTRSAYAEQIGLGPERIYPEGWLAEQESKSGSGLGRALSKLNPFRRRNRSEGFGYKYEGGHRRHATLSTLPEPPQFVQQHATADTPYRFEGTGLGESESSSSLSIPDVEPEIRHRRGPEPLRSSLRRVRHDRVASESQSPPSPLMPQSLPQSQLQPLAPPQPSPGLPITRSDLPSGFMPATPYAGGDATVGAFNAQPQPGLPLSPNLANQSVPVIPGQPLTPMPGPRTPMLPHPPSPMPMPTPAVPLSASPNPGTMGFAGQPRPSVPLSPPDTPGLGGEPVSRIPLSPRPPASAGGTAISNVPAIPPSPMPSPYRAGYTPNPIPGRPLSPEAESEDTYGIRGMMGTPGSRRPRRYPTTPGPRAAAMPMPEPVVPLSPRPPRRVSGMPPLMAAQGPPGIPYAGSKQLKFNAATPPWNELCHLTPAHIAFGGKYWPTAAHLFEAFKFFKHRPDLAERVRRTEDFGELGVLLESLERDVRMDWEDVILEKMEEALYQKIIQSQELVDLLLSTGDCDIVFDEESDPFWGSGMYGEGANELGQALMRVRELVRRKEWEGR